MAKTIKMLGSFLLVLAIFACEAEPNIIRPCLLWDLKCIQSFLGAISQCSTDVVGTIPTTIVPIITYEDPASNSSCIEKDTIWRNLDDCVVSEFLFNMDTKRATLSIDCFNIKYDGYQTVFQHKSRQEDSVYGHYFAVTIPILRLTTNIHTGNSLGFCDGFTFAEVPVLPIYNIDPQDMLKPDSLPRETSEMQMFTQGSFTRRAHPIMNWFLKYKLCDFSCECSNIAKPFVE